jgi:pimeloyl-ACP methyl ester carboxylesterase
MKFDLRLLSLLLLLAWGDSLYSQEALRTMPATSYEILDGTTGIKVSVSVDEFLIAKTEVTQEEFSGVMNYNPAFHKGSAYPVENVSWWEAIQYCNRRSAREGLEPCYNLGTGECDFSRNGYRLPTDAEWGYAGGDPSRYDAETLDRYANLGSKNTQGLTDLANSLKERGTQKVGSYPPNSFGLYDMLGNVWEWCHDFYNPVSNAPEASNNPHGPSRGLARVIRGGSFVTTVTDWNKKKAYRSSMNPDYRSRFTGFRVCRSLTPRQANEGQAEDPKWFEPYNQVPAGFENNIGGLSSLVVTSKGEKISTLTGWPEKRESLKAKWRKLLGEPALQAPEPNAKLVESFEESNYTGKLMYLQVEPDFWEKIYLMLPSRPLTQPLPTVIVPYYDVDTPAGKNLGGRSYMPAGARSFAYLVVQQGYVAVAVRWFGESYGESYDEAVANLLLRHPGCSGLGKWVWDAHRLVDYLYSLPEVDHNHIGIIGHSLGAKMALYAAAMDERINAAVASEGGIGFSFSNYDDYWYFGDQIHFLDKATDQHELLGLIAPRPFLLIGGDEYDTSKSWHYVNAARQVYTLFGMPQNIGYFNHHRGHTPTAEAVERSIAWLKHFLGR